MADPIIYGPAYSTYTRTVRLVHEEKGVAYRLVEVDMLKGELTTAAHLARHPFGKAPAYTHDGFDLYETSAISRYVDEAFPGPTLQPSELRARARMNQIIGVLDSYVYAPMVQKVVIQRLVRPMMGAPADEAAIAEAMPAVSKGCAAIAGLLANNVHMAGPAISLADLHAIPMFAYFAATPDSAEVFAAHPVLKRWWDHVATRPSVRKTAPSFG